MYAKSFGLIQEPFSIAPDPRYLFMSERHREALAHLLYGLGGGGGFVLLSGEIGTGKTTVCRCFLEQIPANCNVAYIFNPKLTAEELLRSICDEFHIALPPDAATAKDFIDPLNSFLLRGHAAGQNNVLIIDEAQNLSADVLEQLRLLTNLETSERKLLQIVLIGQPELRRMLARPELEQLAQRVIARFHLDALSELETSHYIAHRLAVAGLTGASPFNKQALARIHKLARGIPRRINLLCGRALLGAYSTGMAQVDRRTVDKAAAEVFGPRLDVRQPMGLTDANASSPHPGRRLVPASTVALASLAGLLSGAALLGAILWAQKSQSNAPLPVSSPSALKRAPSPAAATMAILPAKPPPVPPTPASPAQGITLLSAVELEAELAATTLTPRQSWQALGRLWGLTLDGSDPCAAAWQQRVACFNSKPTNLALIRELNRPGIITLLDNNKRPAQVVLTGLTDQTASLRMGTQNHSVSLSVLASRWRGDFATLWRVPDDYAEKVVNGKARPVSEWLEAQLAKVPGSTVASQQSSLRDRIYAFQLANGLSADGQAGPMTLMQLNRVAGVKEPQLKTARP
jgi:general secretion pathway protein A